MASAESYELDEDLSISTSSNKVHTEATSLSVVQKVNERLIRIYTAKHSAWL